MTVSTQAIEFDFSIRAHLKMAWEIFKKHVWYFVMLAAVMAVLNVVFNGHHGPIIRTAAGILILIWSYISISSALAAVDGKEGMLSFEALKLHLPTVKQFFLLAVVIIGSAVIILAGFILLVIPGVYFTIRLMFANFALVERKEGAIPAMRYSWHVVQKDIFWTSLLCFVVATILIILGIAVAGVGVLMTYPLALLFLALLYRKLTKLPPQTMVEQSLEIPATA
jgi:uncharacterized membrane protein